MLFRGSAILILIQWFYCRNSFMATLNYSPRMERIDVLLSVSSPSGDETIAIHSTEPESNLLRLVIVSELWMIKSLLSPSIRLIWMIFLELFRTRPPLCCHTMTARPGKLRASHSKRTRFEVAVDTTLLLGRLVIRGFPTEIK